MFTRTRYQFGWLELRKRKKKPSVWLWRYRGTSDGGSRDKEAVIIGDIHQYPTKALAWKAAEGLRLAVNRNNPGADETLELSSTDTSASSFQSGTQLLANTAPG